MTDSYSMYTRDLETLQGRLRKDHPRYSEALTLENRLLENIAQSQRYGDTEIRRAERAQIVESLNQLSLDTVGEPFVLQQERPSTRKQASKGLMFAILAIVAGLLVTVIFVAAWPLIRSTFQQEPLEISGEPYPTFSPFTYLENTVTPIWLLPVAKPPAHSICDESGDWPLANRDTSNNPYTYDFMALPLHSVWNIDHNCGMSRPIVVDGRVYSVNSNGDVLALDISSGAVIWEEYIAQLEGEDVGLAYDSGHLYLASYDGALYAVDAMNGQVLWRYDTRSTINSSPTVLATTLFVGTWSGQLVAINAETGLLKWSFEAGEIFSSDVAADYNAVYAVSRKGILYSVEASSGQEIWRVDIGDTGNGRTPVLFDGNLYISSPSQVLAIDTSTGRVLWTQSLRGLFSVNSVSVDEYLVYVSIPQEYEIVGLDLKNGEIRWRTEMLGPPASRGPVITSRYLFTRMNVGSVDAVVALDKFSGTLLWQQTLTSSSCSSFAPSVTLANHRVIVNAGESSIAFESHAGRLLLTGDSVRIRDVSTGEISRVDSSIYFMDCQPLPNTTSLACVGSTETRWDIYTVDMTTSNVTQVTNFAAKGNAALAVSPSGTRIAFAFGTGEEWIDHGNLYIVDIEKDEHVAITNDSFCGRQDWLGWSPDGRWLVFLSCTDESLYSVVRVDADGQGSTTLGTNANGNISWHPGGTWIAHGSQDGLVLESRDGSQKIVASGLSDWLDYIYWSPSGQQIAIEPWVDCCTGIYVLNADGSNGRWIARYYGNIFPGWNPYSWSLDGSQIAYLASMEEIKVLDACTGDLLTSISLDGFTSNMRWVP